MTQLRPPLSAERPPEAATVRAIVSVRSCNSGIQGPESLILTLARELGRRGVRYVIVNLWDGYPPRVELHDEALRQGFESYVVRGANALDPRIAPRLRALLCRIQPDVVETHDPASQVFALLASFGLPLSLLGHFYGQLSMRSPYLRAQELSSFVVLRLFNRVLANSQAQRAELLRAGFAPQRVDIVPSFVNTTSLVPPSPVEVSAARARLGLAQGCPVLATVARLSPNKGYPHMLRALATIRTAFPDVVYLAAGEGDSSWHGEGGFRGHLERLASELGVAESVRFLGYYPDLRTVLSAADVIVSPSLREGMQVSVLEAMATAKPIVATAIGGTPDAIENERSGLLVPAADPAALARAILGLLSNPARRQVMGEAARSRAVHHFDAEVVAAQVLRVCHEVRAGA